MPIRTPAIDRRCHEEMRTDAHETDPGREDPAAKDDAFAEDCAPRRVMELFSAKWTSHVLHAMHALYGGTCRPGALQRALPGLSKKMLTQTLRELERDGLVARTVRHVVPARVDYSLTPLGRTMIEPIEMLYGWARDHEADLSALGLRARSRRRKARGSGSGVDQGGEAA